VRVVPVGRLDYHTSGVLLFTNDGDFARVMQQPSTGVSKVYVEEGLAMTKKWYSERGLL
jgi:16S rRNA U516 pseudouridylate synthase RsuA-like enzyme